mgnify:CR=1 FL=1
MRRYENAHERLVPLLVEVVGAQSYLEFGTGTGETILKVKCPVRIGVDAKVDCLLPFPSQFLRMTTSDFIRYHTETYAPFDVVFIDADHEAESVLADFDGIWPPVSPEGLVLLHDGNPETVADTAPGYCNNAWEAVRALTGRGKFEMVTLPYHPGLTIVRKRERWGPR